MGEEGSTNRLEPVRKTHDRSPEPICDPEKSTDFRKKPEFQKTLFPDSDPTIPVKTGKTQNLGAFQNNKRSRNLKKAHTAGGNFMEADNFKAIKIS